MNGFCTQIGNAHFAWFGTTGSKNRALLDLLRAGHDDYVINAEALAYMHQRALAGPVIARLAEHPDQAFADQAAWTAHLDWLGVLTLKVNPDPVMVATEGALWGSIKGHGFLPDTVIVSDDAGQFNVGQHGLCWVHAERLVHKLDTFTDEQRKARPAFVTYLVVLSRPQSYRQNPSRQRRATCGHADRSHAQTGRHPTSARAAAPTSVNCSWCSIGPRFRYTPRFRDDVRCQVTKRR